MVIPNPLINHTERIRKEQIRRTKRKKMSAKIGKAGWCLVYSVSKVETHASGWRASQEYGCQIPREPQNFGGGRGLCGLLASLGVQDRCSQPFGRLEVHCSECVDGFGTDQERKIKQTNCLGRVVVLETHGLAGLIYGHEDESE